MKSKTTKIVVPTRICVCGCKKVFPITSGQPRKYATPSCRVRAFNNRKKKNLKTA